MVFFWLALVSRAQVYGRSYYQKYILHIRHYSSSLVQMQAKEGERSSSSSRSSTSCRSRTRESRGAQRLSGARAAIFFLWVILIFTHLSFCVAKLEEADANADRLSRFLPRKARFLETTTTMATTTVPFHASSLSPSESADLINEDEKRIVHTGPNPLHN